ncbi:single-stranded DNA-binding protein [Mesorhizobium sp. M0185]
MAHAQLAHSTVISGFVDSLQEPRTLYISPKRLSEALGVKVANLAQLTGVHRNTLRNPSSERLQGRMREMVKVISAATELTGDVNKAIFWYRNDAGKKETRTDWVTVTVFDDQAAWIKDNVSKGQPVIAEGRINNSSYEKDGETIYTTDLVATTFNAFQAANVNAND